MPGFSHDAPPNLRTSLPERPASASRVGLVVQVVDHFLLRLALREDQDNSHALLLEEALQMVVHMDIGRSIAGNLRPLTSIPASSVYSVRSGGSTKSKTSVLDSPLATSSNASEPSVNNHSPFADGIEMEDNDFGSEKGNSSPSSQLGEAKAPREAILLAKTRGFRSIILESDSQTLIKSIKGASANALGRFMLQSRLSKLTFPASIG
ncbi:hypothetical protein GH714_008283 [Hevea brasiliensis]|uniref:RNase H type-1 domain-containing protein n=1 Tax=Hevea brasiliensis TaxID=3981 RepID=A0A6A6KIG9_HEVBR|nr:hypothetical protein GH714_008283 [Hevea brasiliensis]